MVISKKTRAKQDENWFIFASCLNIHLFSDYLSLKFNHHFEKLTFAPTNVVKMVEVVEKSLKLYLAFQEKPEESLTYFSSEYGHNLEKLRNRAEAFNKLFSDDDIKRFTKPFDDKTGNLYQKLRYGSHAKVEGFKTNLNALMPIVDKIFYNCIFQLDENWKKMLIGNSTLFFLVTESNFAQSQNPDILLQAVKIDNPYYNEFSKLCLDIKVERERIIESANIIEVMKNEI